MKLSDSNNLFKEDDALDYIFFEEIEKGSRPRGSKNGGCLTVPVAMLVPAGGWLLYSQWLA